MNNKQLLLLMTLVSISSAVIAYNNERGEQDPRNNEQYINEDQRETSIEERNRVRAEEKKRFLRDENRIVGRRTIDGTGKVVRGTVRTTEDVAGKTVEIPGKVLGGIFGGRNRN